ncbi:hypothetical protein BJV82DRAFT_178257 [Fennellomyces sp. T-0311]|nr:hypothetical protein BJV82DRAFT_178257 [Fennellomyces sp. T-0311]
MNHNHVSHSKTKPPKKGNITHYFQKLHTTPKETTPQNVIHHHIDLTQSDNDIIDLTDSKPTRGIRVQGGFGSQGAQTEELSSNSKYRSGSSFNFEQQKTPTYSSLKAQPAYTPPKRNRIVPVQRQPSQSSGMSLIDRPNTTQTHTLQGAGMVAAKRQLPSGWVKSFETSASPFKTNYTPPATPSASASDHINKRQRTNVSYISSVDAMAAIQGKPVVERVMKGMTSVSTSRASFASTSLYKRRTPTPKRPSSSTNVYRPPLSSEQQRVFDMVVQDRKNIFFTGSAGTGKSVLLRGQSLTS